MAMSKRAQELYDQLLVEMSKEWGYEQEGEVKSIRTPYPRTVVIRFEGKTHKLSVGDEFHITLANGALKVNPITIASID